jgi:hypothetical protein
VRTPLIVLVRSVTTNTTLRAILSLPSRADPSQVSCVPGFSGNHWLSIVTGSENLRGSKSLSTATLTAVVAVVAAASPPPWSSCEPHAPSASASTVTAVAAIPL